ncbi:hypothetical protein BGZ94_003002 [Podila epigama]|nr:hypothetical protein BGZ94_003002 [Podila epigama]
MALPTQITEDYWVRASAPPEMLSKGRPNPGKWMLFYDKSILDEKWAIVKQMVEQGELGIGAKCSTAKVNPNATNSKTGVIIVYTYDYQDQEDVLRVAITLHEKLQYKGKIYYKSDEQTMAGLYAKTGSKKNHLYVYP